METPHFWGNTGAKGVYVVRINMTLERQNKRSQKGLICVIKKKKRERERKEGLLFWRCWGSWDIRSKNRNDWILIFLNISTRLEKVLHIDWQFWDCMWQNHSEQQWWHDGIWAKGVLGWPRRDILYTYIIKVENKCFLCAVLSCYHVGLFMTPWTVAHQAPLSMGILQARIPEWAAMPSSRGLSQNWDQTQVSCIAGRLFTIGNTKVLFKFR